MNVSAGSSGTAISFDWTNGEFNPDQPTTVTLVAGAESSVPVPLVKKGRPVWC